MSLPGRLLAAALALGVAIAPATGNAETLKIGGTGAALGTMRIVAEAYMRRHPGTTVEVFDSLGSGGGIKAVLAGALQIGLSSRPLKQSERDAGAVATTYAKTPFILVTPGSSGEPINLTSEEITRFFTGKPTTWPDGTPVRIVLRNEGDSTTTMLVENFAGMSEALASARATQGISMAFTDQEEMDLAEDTPGSMATGTLTALLSERRRLTPIAVDGVAPTVENLASGTYRFSKVLSVVVSAAPAPSVQSFMRYLLSAEGATILTEYGNLPVGANDDTG